MPTPEMYSDNGNEDVLDLYIVSIYNICTFFIQFIYLVNDDGFFVRPTSPVLRSRGSSNEFIGACSACAMGMLLFLRFPYIIIRSSTGFKY